VICLVRATLSDGWTQRRHGLQVFCESLLLTCRAIKGINRYTAMCSAKEKAGCRRDVPIESGRLAHSLGGIISMHLTPMSLSLAV
jgi:hypothetical protein